MGIELNIDTILSVLNMIMGLIRKLIEEGALAL